MLPRDFVRNRHAQEKVAEEQQSNTETGTSTETKEGGEGRLRMEIHKPHYLKDFVSK